MPSTAMELALYEATRRQPDYELQAEKPEHRIAMYLIAKAYSTAQVAAAMGKSEAWVLNLRKQPWFKQKISSLLHEAGIDQVVGFLQINSMDALDKVVDLMHNAESERVQLQAASKLVDKIIPDKLDVQRVQRLPPEQLKEQIRIVSEQIAEIEGESPRDPASQPTELSELAKST